MLFFNRENYEKTNLISEVCNIDEQKLASGAVNI